MYTRKFNNNTVPLQVRNFAISRVIWPWFFRQLLHRTPWSDSNPSWKHVVLKFFSFVAKSNINNICRPPVIVTAHRRLVFRGYSIYIHTAWLRCWFTYFFFISRGALQQLSKQSVPYNQKYIKLLVWSETNICVYDTLLIMWFLHPVIGN